MGTRWLRCTSARSFVPKQPLAKGLASTRAAAAICGLTRSSSEPANGYTCLRFEGKSIGHHENSDSKENVEEKEDPTMNSLLCISLLVPGTSEPELLKLQRKEKKSIFA